MKKKSKALILLGNMDIIIAGIALGALIILTFMGVIMRYVMKMPFTWLEEVQLWCMLWIVYISAGAAFRTNNHVAIEVLVEMFPEKIQKVIEILIALVVYVVLGYLFIQSIGFVQLFIRNGRSTNMLEVPYSLIYGAIPIATALMMINYTISLIDQMKSINNKEIEQEDTNE
ncbi:TRAP-type C4-dicarboxylate transport system permease small subunit [Natranaerovirga hydrolytica]|uniref:TRAP-type C4-dicarboxylate transport system permease small subunit n=1 Tax=Natranaerovirga hydrolytica TaxID=680378 RepID=A0A4R1MIX7_9FIRM|nr:TRAP transporter small permease [Natranaerovirga hydrolytica]TCK92367.1 TRAP-type C4-dicarboxylate transport system permease small subunit [Natranaerovirga hydrolytica]